MNEQKAKRLRRAIGFVPCAVRQYDTGKPIHKVGKDISGSQVISTVTGTVVSTGTRQQYQKAKRAGLANILLGY